MRYANGCGAGLAAINYLFPMSTQNQNVCKFINVLIACCLATLLLAACGQKGDLYLPSPTAADASATPAEAGDEQDSEDD